MRIQHNIMAMNAYRNYNTNTSALSKNLEKLSSGYKINRAGDDAAGLAISEKMRAQITGLETAQKNAKDGISLVQTAEGALTEVHDMLNRMVELAGQSANGTFDNQTDRDQLQKEVEALRTEIDRIADSANFNGIKLLDGSMAGTVTGGGSALGPNAPSLVDGTTPTAGTKAKITLDFSTLSAAAGGSGIYSKVTKATTAAALGNISYTNGKQLKDIFSITGSGGKFTLTAKNAGEIDSAIWNKVSDLKGGKGTIDAVNGTNRGGGSAATTAKYEMTFDFSEIGAGDFIEINGTKFVFTMSSTVADTANTKYISMKGVDTSITGTANTNGQWKLAHTLQTKIAAAFGTYSIAAVAAAPTKNAYKLTMTAKNAGSAANMGEVRYGSTNGGAIKDVKYTAGKDKGADKAGGYATVTYDFDLTKLKAGDKITIGNTTISIVSAASEADPAKGKLILADAQDKDKLAAAFEAMGYAAGKLDFSQPGKLTITDTQEGRTGADWAATTDAKVTVATKGGTTTGGLVLQIGDTSDSFNQLQVAIKSCKSTDLGIDSSAVDISSQSKAQASLSVIKDAINKVSDVRGTLGATQNRLDHTINNLSVMTENIQDAESTIRDTDVADEMMAYTKNNILIQSAQAMLAQANQVPQGVLQLLQ